MKKIVTILMVVSMLASMLVITASAEQSNMEVNAPKFTKAPTIDGVVSEEEWGAPTVHVRTDYAATADDTEIGYDPDFDVKNIFYWFDIPEYSDALAYDLWLRWDDDYFYVAAVVADPDPQSCLYTDGDMYRGDSIKIEIDTLGPDSAITKDDPNFNYKTDDYKGSRYNYPWAEDDLVFKATFGLSYGTTPSAFNHTHAFRGPLTTAPFGITNIVHEPASENAFETNTTTYEIAIPWATIDELFVPETGKVLGMVAAVSCSDADERNAWLQWGHGIYHISKADDSESQPRGTRGGSQAVVLADDENNITPADSYAVATEGSDETTAPETTAPAETNAADGTAAPAQTNGAGNAAATTAAPAQTNGTGSNNSSSASDGLPTGAIIGIVAAAVVVIAAVVIVITKKKK